MIDTSMPRDSSAWAATWPKRPKPISNTVPSSPSGMSMPSKEGMSISLPSQSPRMASSGVMAMEMMTAALNCATESAEKMAALAAAA